MKLLQKLSILFAICMLFTPTIAEEESQEAPAPGPPPHIQQVAGLVGTWSYEGQVRWDPTQEWTDHQAVVVYSYVCGGAALQMTYEGEMMGNVMHGVSLTTYDKELHQWQEIWVDNLVGRMSYYTGDFKDGQLVVGGEEIMDGVRSFSRSSIFDITDSTFKWTMESSPDGVKWGAIMQGTYTKK